MRNGYRDTLLAVWIFALVVTIGSIVLVVSAFASFDISDGTVPAPQNYLIAYGASVGAVLGAGATFFAGIAWLVVGAIGRDASSGARSPREAR
jgi:type II secretory pathway component PulF